MRFICEQGKKDYQNLFIHPKKGNAYDTESEKLQTVQLYTFGVCMEGE